MFGMKSRRERQELAIMARNWLAASRALLKAIVLESKSVTANAVDWLHGCFRRSTNRLMYLSRPTLSKRKRGVIAAIITLVVGLPASVIGNGAWELCKSVATSLSSLFPSPSPLAVTEYRREITSHTTGTLGQGTAVVEVFRGPNGVLREQVLYEVSSTSMSPSEKMALATRRLESQSTVTTPSTILGVQNTSGKHLVPSDFGGPILLELSRNNAYVVSLPLENLGFQQAKKSPRFQSGSTLELEPFFLRSGEQFGVAIGSPDGPVAVTNAWGGPVGTDREFSIKRAPTVAR